jgi:hypothetical protein
MLKKDPKALFYIRTIPCLEFHVAHNLLQHCVMIELWTKPFFKFVLGINQSQKFLETKNWSIVVWAACVKKKFFFQFFLLDK